MSSRCRGEDESLESYTKDHDTVLLSPIAQHANSAPLHSEAEGKFSGGQEQEKKCSTLGTV